MNSTNFGEVRAWPCSFQVTQADRQMDRQTDRQTDILITILCTPPGAKYKCRQRSTKHTQHNGNNSH